MHVEFGGDGQGIVLLHGLMDRARSWWSVAQWLRRYGRVVGLDARGHGRNPRRGPYRTELFVDDVAAAIEELGLGPAVVIGHSMGGLHAVGLAARRPDLVRAVVVEEFAPDHRGRTAEGWREWFDLWPVPFQSLAHVRQVLGEHFTELVEERADGYHLIVDLDDMFEIAAEWSRRDYWSWVDAVRCPLLAIEASPSTMPAGQLRAVAERTSGRYLAVPDAGHLVHEDAPDVYRGALEAFLASLP